MVQHIAVGDQDVEGFLMGRFDEAADLFVDGARDLFGVVAGVPHVAAQEHLPLPLAVLDRAEALRHAVLGDHRPRDTRGLLDVVGRASGRVVEHQFLGRTTTEHVRELVEHLGSTLGVLLLIGEHHRVAQRPTTGQDRDLVDRVVAGQRRSHDRVATLVVGRDLALFLVHDAGALLGAGDHSVDGFVERLVGDQGLVVASREQRGLVQDVGQIRAGEPGGSLGDALQVDVGRQRLSGRMDLEDRLTALEVRRLHCDLTVETTGPQQGGVQDVRPVRGRDQDDATGDVEAIHLDQHLVQGLFPLVVTAAQTRATMAADGVDLVDEDDGRRIGLGLFEEVADARGTHTHEHLDEVRPRDREERHPRLARDRASEQGFAGSGRAVQQDALGDLGAHRGEAGGLLEELLDLLEFLDGFLGPGDVGERRLGHVLADDLGLRLAEGHEFAAAALHLVQEEEQQEQDQQDRQERHQQRDQQVLLRDLDVIAVLELPLVELGLQHLLQLHALAGDVLRGLL